MSNEIQTNTGAGKIEPRPIVEEMQESYLDYAMSVIVARALPDVRDGLKPVHRRILYAMHSMGLRPGAKFRKSATIIGEVLGKYHPHGDSAVYDAMVRMAQEFSLRYPLVWGQGNFGCFTKDTKVKLTDGRDLRFGDLVEEHLQGKKNYTYTINSVGSIEIAEIKNPRKTRKNAQLVKVTLDNGAEITCTPNHLFMLRDGSYKEASALRPQESLMPIYQRLSVEQDRLNRKGYALIYQNKKAEWVPVHHLADNYNLTAKKYLKSAGRVRHHIDFNKRNNNPTNIVRVNWREHWKIHYEHASQQHRNPEYRKKIAEGRKRFWSDPLNKEAYSKRLSQRNHTNWQRPDYQEKMRRLLSDINKEYIKHHPEERLVRAERGSKTFKRLWKDLHYRNLFHAKIVSSNKNRITNNTGKIKFLKVCKEIVNAGQVLNAEQYEQTRAQLYPYGCSTSWEIGIKKYYNNDPSLAIRELTENHKVVRVESLHSREDVYDLTINESHNFALAAGVFVHNSMDGDAAAAYRYTEAKLAAIAEELLQDIEKETVSFIPNYDGTHKEPTVLPSKLPNLLLSGSMGIAVGMATNIPPHNLKDICAGIAHVIENPECTVEELMKFVPGPDFPTGGIIYNREDIKQAYATGRGSIVVRAKAEVVDVSRIVVAEIPYGVNKADLITHIADLVRDKKMEGIRDLRDESNKEGVRIVIELKKDAYPKKVLNQLYDNTALQTSFHVNMLALLDGLQPRVLNLKHILEEHIKHREAVVRRRTEFDLRRAKERAHILEGLKIAIVNIDKVIAIIKKSQDRDEAKINLIKKFKLTEVQSIAILEMRLQQLANLERLKVETELKEKLALIKELQAILASPKKILNIIAGEIKELSERYGDKRRTEIVPHAVKEFRAEDLIPDEPTIVMITADGYIKRLPPETFKRQGRGGKGVVGFTTKEEDVVEHLFTTTTHASLLFFTSRGRVFKLKAYEVPQAARTAKGQAVVNFLELAPGEKVATVLSLKELGDYKYLVMVTARGLIKKVDIGAFEEVRRSGLIAIKLKAEDNLEWIKPSSGKDEIILITAKGQAVRFKEGDVRPMGRVAAGVRGIRLKGADRVVGMDVLDAKLVEKGLMELFVLMENGFGKRTDVKSYKLQRRGGSGIKTARVTEKTGEVVGAFVVNAKDERDLILISAKGQVVRIPLRSISVLGRATQGVRVMRFKVEGDGVASVTVV